MLVPLGTRCVIVPVQKTTKEIGAAGLFINEESIAAPQSIKADVVALGKDVEVVKVGDIVLVSQFGPTEAKENVFDKTLVVAEEDILCIIKPDKVTSK